MTIDPTEAVERDDLAPPHLTPTKRLHIIAELLAEGVRRQRDDLRRMGEIGQHPEREADGLEPFEPVRLDRPPPTMVDALRTGESTCPMIPTRRSWPLAD